MKGLAISILFIGFSSSFSFATSNNAVIVPETKLPNEKNHVYQELIEIGQLDDRIDVLKANSADFYYFKRLHTGQPAPNTPMVPDDAAIVDTFATCLAKRQIPQNEFRDLSIHLNQAKGVMEARYPLDYECSFDKAALLKALDEYVATYRNIAKPGLCDGAQMRGYVKAAIEVGHSVLALANDPTWGARAPRLAISSRGMGDYISLRSDIRDHDLFLVRSGCKSLSGGPTDDMMIELKTVELELRRLANREYTEQGLVTGTDGELK